MGESDYTKAVRTGLIYALDARWEVLSRMMAVLEASFLSRQNLEREGGHNEPNG